MYRNETYRRNIVRTRIYWWASYCKDASLGNFKSTCLILAVSFDDGVGFGHNIIIDSFAVNNNSVAMYSIV